jgi:hypothetical protein
MSANLCALTGAKRLLGCLEGSHDISTTLMLLEKCRRKSAATVKATAEATSKMSHCATLLSEKSLRFYPL